MTSIMSGKMRIERAPVELGRVLSEAVETVRPQADVKGVALELADGDGAAGAATALVSGDRTRLVQVFWNLLSNAVKFSRKGARVRVESRADGAAARVEVVDEGSGIETEFLPRVFDRFSQADGSTTRAHGGLGLGLALVKSFVEAHGGTAEVFSDGPGRGSRFAVMLPLINEPEADGETGRRGEGETWGRGDGEAFDKGDAESETFDDTSSVSPSPPLLFSPSPRPPVSPSAPAARRVLLVEDARDTLEMLRVVIGLRGYEAVGCASAEEALSVAPAARFDIIVSDIGLPRIDGYELIRRLRDLPHLRDTPALALTGYAAAKDAEAALAAGFDAHLPKPVEPSALADEIERLLRRSRGGEGD
jgi:CheY-like chemotaxis protein